MAQILDTQVSGSGAYILDTQESGVPTPVTATVSFVQESNTVAVTAIGQVLSYTASVAVTQEDNTVSAIVNLPVVVDHFTVRVRHKTTGAALTGLTNVNLTIFDPATGYRLDFSDFSFKASPVMPVMAMTEVSAASLPGLYRASIQTTNMNGWIGFETTYFDGSYTYAYPGEAYYVAGHRATGAWIGEHQSQMTAIQSAVSGIPVAVLAQLLASIIPTNMVQIKGQAINGSGSVSDPWGP